MRLSKNRIAVVVMGFAALTAGAAHAGGTQSVSLNATVLNVCLFQTQTPSITIANTGSSIDPSLAGPATGSTTVSYKCTKGAAAALTSPPATGSVSTGGATPSTMSVGLVYGALAAGNGFGQAAQTFTVTANITQANYQDSPAGTYTGTVTLTINN